VLCFCGGRAFLIRFVLYSLLYSIFLWCLFSFLLLFQIFDACVIDVVGS
jgi:hypothetical protein